MMTAVHMYKFTKNLQTVYLHWVHTVRYPNYTCNKLLKVKKKTLSEEDLTGILHSTLFSKWS